MDKAIIATIDAVRTRVSTNEVLIALAIPLEQAALVGTLLQKVGHQVGVAFAELEEAHKSNQEASYGSMASSLMTSSFFRMPQVWRKVGTDEAYLDWLRTQPCAYCGDYDYIQETGEKKAEAAHVRRVSQGSGTSIKPAYSAIPLCHKHHLKQHSDGESCLGDEEWWMKKRMDYVRQWCKISLKSQLGYDSWTKVPPEVLRDWAETYGVAGSLPKAYRDG